jgi:hypothetical protein
MKSGVFRGISVAHGGSGRVSGRCLPYDVSVESFEETDTARNPAFDRRRGRKELCWDRMGATELVGDVGVSS